MAKTETKAVRRVVPAELIEATPERGALGHWALASPALIFVAWTWIDLLRGARLTPLPWLNTTLGVVTFLALVMPILGWLMHRLVLTLPRLFQHAGWDVEPLEPVTTAEQYTVRYRYQRLRWAANSWSRTWLRVAQGWVFLEVAGILLLGLLMIPLFLSATELGFGT